MSFMKKILSVLFALLLGFTVFAQSADVITDILESEKVTFGQVCYITAVQMNLADENVSFDDAVKVMKEQGYLLSDESSETPIPAVDIAYLYSKCWPIKGGMLFRITKGSPRYAFKQFIADGVLDPSVDPSSFLTGTKALSFYTACVNTYSGFDMSAVSMEEE